MKKIFSLILAICLLFSSVTCFAYGITIDSIHIDGNMEFQNGTVYISVEDVAQSLGKGTHWDERTQTVFVNGIYLFPKKSENITVYVDGEEKIKAEGAIINNKTYLPAHIVAAAFDLSATWDDNKGEVQLKSDSVSLQGVNISEAKTYAVINKATGKALTVKDGALTTEEYTKTENQKFTFIKTEFDGFYHIRSVTEGKNLDVNGHGTTAGVSIILWEQGSEDNQKFMVEAVPGGNIIYSRNRNLPIEPLNGGIIQNTKTLSSNQKWEIIEFGTAYTPKTVVLGNKLVVKTIPQKPETEEETITSYTFTTDDKSLADSEGLKLTTDFGDKIKWTLNPVANDVYVITNLATGRSLDVSARSLEEGGSIITYNTNSDTNQRWILEKQSDGKYLIKSVHSSLYLTVSEENTLVQMSQNSSLKQKWIMTPSN